MPGELRGSNSGQRARDAERRAILAASITAKQAAGLATSGVGDQPMLPAPPSGMEGMTPDLAALGLGTGAGGPPLAPMPGIGGPISGNSPVPGSSPDMPLPPPGGMPPPMPTPGGGLPTPPPAMRAGGVVGAAASVASGPARALKLSKSEVAAMMPPGVRPIGNILPAPVLFHLMVEAIHADHAGRPMPQFAAGGVTDAPDEMVEMPMPHRVLAQSAGLTSDEAEAWDGANSGPPAPPAFEDWLDEVAPQNTDEVSRELVSLYGSHPELVSALWNIVVERVKMGDLEVPDALCSMVNGEGQEETDEGDTGPAPEPMTAAPPADLPPPPAY